MLTRITTVLMLLLFGSINVEAQLSGTFHLFPQFADGTSPDGSFYRSTLMIQPAFTSSPVTCNLTLYQMTADFGLGAGSAFPINIPIGGFAIQSTTGTQTLKSGYASLTCNASVDAQVLYALYVGGVKSSEATVFSSNSSSTVKILADQTANSRLGIAIANNTDISHTYAITLVTSAGQTFGTASVPVARRSSVARFLDELDPSTKNQVLQVQIRTSDFSSFSVIGLRFTGPVFTTIPAN